MKGNPLRRERARGLDDNEVTYLAVPFTRFCVSPCVRFSGRCISSCISSLSPSSLCDVPWESPLRLTADPTFLSMRSSFEPSSDVESRGEAVSEFEVEGKGEGIVMVRVWIVADRFGDEEGMVNVFRKGAEEDDGVVEMIIIMLSHI